VADVFIVCNSTHEMGGLTRWAHHVARLLAERGHRVRIVGIAPAVVAHDYGSDLPYTCTTLYRRNPAGNPRTRLARTRSARRMRELRRRGGMRFAASRLSRMFAAVAPGGVVIAAQVWAMEWVARADTHGMPVIGMSHESYAATRESSRYRRVRRYYRNVDRLMLLTRADADRWAFAEGFTNVDAMPNPMPLTPETPSPRTAKTVVSVGRLSYEKGFDLLLEAWAEVAAAFPDWRLRIVGAGPEDAALRARATELGVAGGVDFAGQSSDVEADLRGASVYALPSRAEGFPMTLLEAMAMGLPCAAFDCAPGVREIITDGDDGLVVAAGNTGQLADALSRLLADADLRDAMSRRALASVERFTPAHIADRWERLFEFVYR
jgi:glycosyltransferase involved in cell wall biosynthesis